MEPELKDTAMEEARRKMRERLGDSGGVLGKGMGRRKRAAVAHKSAAGDDKKLQQAIKKLGMQQIPGIDEVAMIKNDGNALRFVRPSLQASIPSCTFVISGTCETKKVEQLFQFPPELDADTLERLTQQLKKLHADGQAQAEGKLDGLKVTGADDDDDVPDLVENFEDASS